MHEKVQALETFSKQAPLPGSRVCMIACAACTARPSISLTTSRRRPMCLLNDAGKPMVIDRRLVARIAFWASFVQASLLLTVIRAGNHGVSAVRS